MLAMAALVILIGALWWPALDAAFQFDDYVVILDNPRVHSLAAWLHSMPGIRPLLKLSYALNYSWGGEPRGFRLVNVAIHAVNACLLAVLLWRRTIRHGLPPGAAMFATALATLVFALHPVQTEAVTYISGRSVSLAALCSLLSLACWLRGGEYHTRPARIAWRGGALLAFIAAMGVRETAIVLPLALWLWNATEPGQVPQRSTVSSAGAQPRPPASSDSRGLAPFIALGLLALAVVLIWPPYRFLIDTSLSIRSIGMNLLTQAHALGYLARQLLPPWHMNADPAFTVTLQLDAATGLLLLLWAGILSTGLALRRRHPSVAFGLLWFFLWLAPTNSLLARHDIVNDRQLYLALIGPAWLLGYGLALTAQRRLLAATATVGWVHPVVATLVVLAFATPLATATMQRNKVYATEISFWEDVVRRTPGNARAANNLGMAYAHACRDADAAAQFRRAMRLRPDDYRAGVNLWLLRRGVLISETRTRVCRDHDTATPAR